MEIIHIYPTQKTRLVSVGNCIEQYASESTGKAKKTGRYRNFWDKELDKMIKERHDCNRLNGFIAKHVIQTVKAEYTYHRFTKSVSVKFKKPLRERKIKLC